MIQFLGRWAAATVVQYVEEALEEVTASWSSHGQPANDGAEGTEPTVQLRSLAPNLGTTGGAAKLSERMDQIEQLLNTVREQQQSASATMNKVTESMIKAEKAQTQHKYVITPERIHVVPSHCLSWPPACWAAICGWRFAHRADIEVVDGKTLQERGVPLQLCGRCQKASDSFAGAPAAFY
jgi:hypothetical protein